MQGTAPEQVLNELHTLIAQVLIKALNAKEYLEIEGEQVEISAVSPAMVAQAIKFLKDNNITSVPELDENLNELKDILAQKRKHSNMASNVSPIDAAREA